MNAPAINPNMARNNMGGMMAGMPNMGMMGMGGMNMMGMGNMGGTSLSFFVRPFMTRIIYGY